MLSEGWTMDEQDRSLAEAMERERFRAGMRGRRGYGFGRGDARAETEATR